MGITDTIRMLTDSTGIITRRVAGEKSLPGYLETPSDWKLDCFSGASDISVLSELAVYSGIIGIVMVIFLALFGIGLTQRTKGRASFGRIRLPLMPGFLFVWFFGFLVYDIGMCNGQYISLLSNAPMATILAFRIFLFNSDVSEINSVFYQNTLYSFLFALVHFLAAGISTLFLIKHFGYNILSRFRMWKTRNNVDETFVFWGFNDATYNLADSINRHYKDSGSSYRIIIVRTNQDDNDSPEESTGFARIFDFLSLRNAELDRLQNLRCLTDSTFKRLSGISAGDVRTDVIGEELKMKSLRRLLCKTNNKIHILFLSDNENENIHNLEVLRNDSTINRFADSATAEGYHVIFYCHARYNSIHQVIEDRNVSNVIKVKVVDSSHINVEMLKQNPALLPVNFVDIGPDARVSSAFNALVIGFSEVGLDSASFLYEYGAFVRKGGTDNTALRSDFHLDVVDRNMDELAGAFIAGAPSVNPSLPFIKGMANPHALITLHKMDCRSAEFYLRLREWIRSLNYIVISTDNDELNISLAVRIFKLAARYRRDMRKLCILTRAHNDDDGHIRRIAFHYNRLWAAYDSSPRVLKKFVHQTSVKSDDIVLPPIHIFGLDNETYTYNNIIADTLEKRAHDYKERYEKTVNPDAVFKKSAWNDFYDDILQLDGRFKGFSPTYFGMMCLRRNQTQDFANSTHELTKSILIREALRQCGLDISIFRQLSRLSETTEYIWPEGTEPVPEIITIATVLAQTEHLRWNASHEILGYTASEIKDEVRLLHDCLKDWSQLSPYIRSFDYNVADLIFGVTIIPKSKK